MICGKQNTADKLFKDGLYGYSYLHIEKTVLNLDDLSVSEITKIKPFHWDGKKFWFEIPDKVLKDYIKRTETHLQKIKNILQ